MVFSGARTTKPYDIALQHTRIRQYQRKSKHHQRQRMLADLLLVLIFLVSIFYIIYIYEDQVLLMLAHLPAQCAWTQMSTKSPTYERENTSSLFGKNEQQLLMLTQYNNTDLC